MFCQRKSSPGEINSIGVGIHFSLLLSPALHPYILFWRHAAVLFKCCDKVVIVMKTGVEAHLCQTVSLGEQPLCHGDPF